MLKLMVALYFFLIVSHNLDAQSVVSSSGNYGQWQSGSITWTIGQGFYQTISNSANTLTQGFNQPLKQAIELVDKEIGITIYPNPTRSQLTIQTSNNFSDLTFELLDIQGRILIVKSTTANSFVEMSMDNVSTGLYFLKISDAQGRLIRTYKVEKID
ncbi:MAG: T9SS type A sorting domain-containing protein [Bacteroidetes bacterium]|nr:T9SS type A sorting domain-containing protein [Bacteroidota bacterium]